MPLLTFLADTNTVSDYFRDTPVKAWMKRHKGRVAISTLTLAEMRRGVEAKRNTKAHTRLEALYRYVLEDYREGILAFDEAAAMEWGRLLNESPDPLPYDDSLIGAIARAYGLQVVTRNEKHFPGCATVNPWK